MKKGLIIALLSCTSYMYSQGNCLIYPEGSNERKACELAHQRENLKQGSRESQIMFDSILKINPNYAWAYMEKSVAYLKRGLITEGLRLLDKAVELEPRYNLTYRAYWHFQNRNYKLCIKDLERFYALPNAFIYEMTPGGDKDMRILLGMSYAKLGNYEKGIETIENCLKSYKREEDFGLTDYHTLGMLYVKNKQYKKALEIFDKQLKITEDYPDSYYYIGLAYKALNKPEKAKVNFQKAKDKFLDGYHIRNGYLCYKVYYLDVTNELEALTD
ncbi:tetratricopeptide repeat protein [Kordia sp. YSTF-M3]|uniref:Tetratricopeptide repeat protein n=1 Tax=Kordia aestuariivivens TaxID=2759037 RepID=A0ABR7Q751_9FLAO|nr:tetratricopeptide repeat protein [Kordia aestuariivivens]MBC8754318.1 tetratricopeptide repeat protein [Kordia aestuariivivens]